MKIYIAGPMRGMLHFNYPAFYAAAKELRDQGHFVFNPAERDIERHDGKDVSIGNLTGDLAQAEQEHGFSIREALAEDLEFICRHADCIALLPGWVDSKGALAERATGRALGL